MSSAVTVIIPVHNAEDTLESAVTSVLRQTFTDFELLLVLHRCSDDSPAMCRAFAAGDSRVRVLEAEGGRGAGRPRNLGIQEASSDWIAFLDADDRMPGNALEAMYRLVKNPAWKADLVIGGYQEFISGKKTICTGTYALPARFLMGKEAVRVFFASHYPDLILGAPWNKLYRKDLILKSGEMFPDMRRLEDGIFNCLYFDLCENLTVTETVVNEHLESAQVELGKLDDQFFDEMRYFTRFYYQTLEKWGLDPAEYEQKIADYYQADLVSLLEKILWSGSAGKSVAYRELDRIRTDPLTQDMLKKPCRVGRYCRTAIWLFTRRKYRTLSGWIGFKYYLKKDRKGIFYYLRSRLN